MAVLVHTPDDRKMDVVRSSAPKDATENSRWQVVSSADPYVHVAEVAPGASVPLHSHSTTEVMVVLSGAVTVAGRRCEAGSIVIIPAHERYSLEVDSGGPLSFAVVRPTPAEYVDER